MRFLKGARTKYNFNMKTMICSVKQNLLQPQKGAWGRGRISGIKGGIKEYKITTVPIHNEIGFGNGDWKGRIGTAEGTEEGD